MYNKSILLILIFYLFLVISCKKSELHSIDFVPKLNDVEKAFKNIDTTYNLISFTNSFDIPKENGHIQGAQILDKNGVRYIILSGSSSNIGYSVVLKLDKEKGNKTISMNTLSNSPFRHAGGIQLIGQYMGVGIEDNKQRDKSKVQIYDVSNPEHSIENPVFELLRSGTYERSTAGGIAMIEWQQHIIMVVVDWDSENLDFYTCPVKAWNQGEIAFKLWKSIETKSLNKEGWVNDEWRSYQNINLISDKNNNLYAVGLDGFNVDKYTSVADLFKLNLGNITDSKPISMIKVSRKEFQNSSGVSFTFGAGIHVIDENSLGIIATCRNIKEISHLNYFK